MKRPRRAATVVAAALAVALAACSGGGGDDDSATTRPPRTDAPTTTTAPPVAPLTGLPDPDGQSRSRPVLWVKVENLDSAQVRPQSGLEVADVVYEEVVEGGITRFLAAYNSAVPDVVGPIRSVRLTDPNIVWPLGGIFAYSGGAQPAVDAINQAPVTTVDESNAGDAMFRDDSRDVDREHTCSAAGARSSTRVASPRHRRRCSSTWRRARPSRASRRASSRSASIGGTRPPTPTTPAATPGPGRSTACRSRCSRASRSRRPTWSSSSSTTPAASARTTRRGSPSARVTRGSSREGR